MSDIGILLDYSSIWEEIKDNLKFRLGENIYNNWLAKINFEQADDKNVTLSASSKFIADWVNINYKTTLEKLFRYYLPNLLNLEIITNNNFFDEIDLENKNNENSVQHYINNVNNVIPANNINNLWMESYNNTIDQRFTFENFITGSSNRLAYEAANAVAESRTVNPATNPLFLYGGVGLGKTHLMHSIANFIKHTDSNRKVIYLSAEKFMYEFVKALRTKDIMTFKEQFRSVDVLMIDDVQFICGKDSTQEEFFHTFNALIDNNKQIVLSCDRSPSALDNIEERVRSRFGRGLAIDIHSTDYELRLGILQLKCEQLGAELPTDVIELLASKITSNVRELEGALNKVIAYSNYMGKKIDVMLVCEILKDLFRASEKAVTIEEIQKIVAEYYGIKLVEMSSSRRLRAVARPRQVAMYLSKTLTVRSLSEIGKKFGGKDHTTVLHAVRTIEKMLDTNHEIREDITMLSNKLR